MGSTYDGFVTTDGDDLWDRIRIAHRRFEDVVTSSPPDRRAARSEWTTQQVSAHVHTVLRRYLDRDLTSREGLSDHASALVQQNEAELKPWADVPVSETLPLIAESLDEIEAKFPRDGDPYVKYPFHGGQFIDGAGGLCNLIGEFLMHGRDIAHAGRKRWPVDGHDAALILNVAYQVSPGFVAPDAPRELVVELRTPHTKPWILDLQNGSVESRLGVKGERVDVRMFGRSQPLVLSLYGRIGQVEATLRGSTVTGGRRPWRAPLLAKAFVAG